MEVEGLSGLLAWLDSVSAATIEAELAALAEQHERLRAQVRLLEEALELKRLDEVRPKMGEGWLSSNLRDAAPKPDAPARLPAQGPARTVPPTTVRDAIGRVFAESPERPRTVQEITSELARRGWLAGKQEGAVGVALVRMARGGALHRVRKGLYAAGPSPARPPEAPGRDMHQELAG